MKNQILTFLSVLLLAGLAIGCGESLQPTDSTSNRNPKQDRVLTDCDGTFTDLWAESNYPGTVSLTWMQDKFNNGWVLDTTTADRSISAKVYSGGNIIVKCGTYPSGSQFLRGPGGGHYALKTDPTTGGQTGDELVVW